MYVDGFLLPLPKNRINEYLRQARKAGKIWQKHGALEYRESIGDDLGPHKGMGMGFPRASRAKRGETVVFSWILYRNRTHRDRVNRKVMADPAMKIMMEQAKDMPFDVKRMAYAGFDVRVAL